MTWQDLKRALEHQRSHASIPIRFDVEPNGSTFPEIHLTLRAWVTSRDNSGTIIELFQMTRIAKDNLAQMDEQAVIEWVWHQLVRPFFLHEAAEIFMWKNKLVKDPHTPSGHRALL